MIRCLDEGKLQSYFDGELSIEMMESVTSHLASCVTCAAAARELEEESAFVMSALAAEIESDRRSPGLHGNSPGHSWTISAWHLHPVCLKRDPENGIPNF